MSDYYVAERGLLAQKRAVLLGELAADLWRELTSDLLLHVRLLDYLLQVV